MGRKAATESTIVTACLKLLTLRRVYAFRVNQIPVKGHTFRGLRGVADILGILDDGRFLAIEVKTETGQLRPEQAAFLDAIRQRGGLSCVVRSVADLDAVLRLEMRS